MRGTKGLRPSDVRERVRGRMLRLNTLRLQEVKDDLERLGRHLMQEEVVTVIPGNVSARPPNNRKERDSPSREIIDGLNALRAGEKRRSCVQQAHTVSSARRDVMTALKDQDGRSDVVESDLRVEQRGELTERKGLGLDREGPVGDSAAEVACEVDVGEGEAVGGREVGGRQAAPAQGVQRTRDPQRRPSDEGGEVLDRAAEARENHRVDGTTRLHVGRGRNRDVRPVAVPDESDLRSVHRLPCVLGECAQHGRLDLESTLR